MIWFNPRSEATTESSDEQWLRALAGSPDAQATSVADNQAGSVRSALQTRRDALDITVPAADGVLYRELQKRMDEERRQQRIKTNWKRTLGLALAAFAVGVVVARFAILSSAPAARSTGPSAPDAHQYAQGEFSGVSRRQVFQTPVVIESGPRLTSITSGQFPVDQTVRVYDPLAFVESVSREAMRLGLSVSVAKDGGAYRLYVSGLGSIGISEQQRLRDTLSLPQSTSSSILVRVEKGENVRRHPYDVQNGEKSELHYSTSGPSNR